MTDLDTSSVALIVALAGVSAAAIGAVGMLLLRVGRSWRLTRQLLIVVLAPTATIAVASMTLSSAMFLSPHDLAVTLWIVVVTVIASLVVVALLGRSFLRTIRGLLESARTVGSGAEVASVDHRTTELRGLSAELAATNTRLVRARVDLERMDQSRRELMAWVSHDLRTPLASVRAMAEALEDGLVDDPTRYHRGIRTQVDRLSRLVDDLFELSKLVAGAVRLQPTTFSVYDLISDQIADFSVIAEERSIAITASGDLETVIKADPHQLSRALGNLLTNALKFSPPDSVVEIAVHEVQGAVELAVTDQGGGIRQDDLTRVFEPGWRADHARAGNPTSGAGLGLAIVRGIVNAHSGEVKVENVPGGSRFTITLPKRF